MNAQAAVQPRLLELERQYAPQWQQLQSENQIRGMQLMQDAYGQTMPRSAELSQQYAEGMQPAFASIGTSARNAYNATLDPSVSGLMGMLGQQSTADLARGTALSPEEQQQSQQSARMAMAARGLSGNQAVGQEVLNSYQLGQFREDRARQFGAGMYSAGLAQTQSANAMYGMPLMQQMAALSPAGLVQGGSGMYTGMGAQIFQPESQYNAGIITANRKEEMDARIATAQNKSAFASGLMGAVGAAAGGFMGGPAFAASGWSALTK